MDTLPCGLAETGVCGRVLGSDFGREIQMESSSLDRSTKRLVAHLTRGKRKPGHRALYRIACEAADQSHRMEAIELINREALLLKLALRAESDFSGLVSTDWRAECAVVLRRLSESALQRVIRDGPDPSIQEGAEWWTEAARDERAGTERAKGAALKRKRLDAEVRETAEKAKRLEAHAARLAEKAAAREAKRPILDRAISDLERQAIEDPDPLGENEEAFLAAVQRLPAQRDQTAEDYAWNPWGRGEDAETPRVFGLKRLLEWTAREIPTGGNELRSAAGEVGSTAAETVWLGDLKSPANPRVDLYRVRRISTHGYVCRQGHRDFTETWDRLDWWPS